MCLEGEIAIALKVEACVRCCQVLVVVHGIKGGCQGLLSGGIKAHVEVVAPAGAAGNCLLAVRAGIEVEFAVAFVCFHLCPGGVVEVPCTALEGGVLGYGYLEYHHVEGVVFQVGYGGVEGDGVPGFQLRPHRGQVEGEVGSNGVYVAVGDLGESFFFRYNLSCVDGYHDIA